MKQVCADSLILDGVPLSEEWLRCHLHEAFLDEQYDLEWEYIGQTSNGCHVVWSNVYEPAYYFWGLHILKQNDEGFVVTDIIDGCIGCEVYGNKIEGNKLIFSRLTTTAGVVYRGAELFPEINRFVNRSSKEGIGSGKAYYCGYFKYATHIDEAGKVQEPVFEAFYPAEGWPPYSHKVFEGESLKKLVMEMLADIDADKPEEFKEEGVAFSPVCFQALLEDDLEGNQDAESEIEIANLKDATYYFTYNRDFSWAYLGRYERFHVIYASLKCGDYSQRNSYTGLYTLVLENGRLKKVARLLRAEGAERQILGDSYYYPSTLEKSKLTVWVNDPEKEEGAKSVKLWINKEGAVAKMISE